MRVLVADKFEDSGLDGLRAAGCGVAYEPDLVGDALKAALAEGGAEALIVRSTEVTADMFEGVPLKLVVRAGAGYNTIDVEAAATKRIAVANCPGTNSDAVAELTIGLLISLDRRIPDNVAQLREGKWNKAEFSKARGLKHRTLGIVGFGHIGQRVANSAKSFGMDILVLTRGDVPSEYKRASGKLELAKRSDAVAVCTSLRDDTRGLCDADFFEAMRDGAYFINTARAEIVDQDSLLAALRSGKIRAGLDVFAGEPEQKTGEYSGELRDLPNCYCTHHIGASTDQAQEAVADEAVRVVSEFKKTGKAPNVVNGV